MAKPWILETLFFWGVLWQESFRLSSRTSQQVLLVGSGLQDFYYYHFGDFVNGYVIAYVLDGLVNLPCSEKRIEKQSSQERQYPGFQEAHLPFSPRYSRAWLLQHSNLTSHRCRRLDIFMILRQEYLVPLSITLSDCSHLNSFMPNQAVSNSNRFASSCDHC